MDVMEYFAIGLLVLTLMAGFGFWIWMLVECVTKEAEPEIPRSAGL
jgi:hypothetical protein